MHHFAVHGMGFGIDDFQALFLKSGAARQMAQGNSWYILNLFGHEVAEEVLRNLGWKQLPGTGSHRLPPESAELWAGGIAARLQWRECISFEDLHSLLPMKELVSFWPDYMGYGTDFAVEDLEPLLEKRGLHRLPSWIEWCKALRAQRSAAAREENAGPADPVPARA